MRISTSQLYNVNIASQQKGYSAIVKTQQQVSSGERIQTAGDDPVGAARLMQLGQQQALLTQYNGNLATATNRLSQEEAVLGSVYNVLQHARELTLEAGSGALTDAERGAIADQLEQIEEQLYSLMNSKDVNGQYLFAGSASASQPYVRNPDGSYSFQGNQQSLDLQVSGSLSLSTNDSGWDIFDNLSNAGRTTSTVLSAPVRIVPGTNNSLGVTLSTDALIEDGKLPEFQAGAPYTLELTLPNDGSDPGFVIYGRDGAELKTGVGAVESDTGTGTIEFRGVQFQFALPPEAEGKQSFQLGGESLAFLSPGLVSNDKQYHDGFRADAPYTLQLLSDSEYAIYKQDENGEPAMVGGGHFEPNASGATSIQFRGVEFQLNLAQLASDDPSLLDGYSFELAAADDRFAIASNSAAQLSSQVSGLGNSAKAFPDAGVVIAFGSVTSEEGVETPTYSIYLQPYREGQSEPIVENHPFDGQSLDYAGVTFTFDKPPASGDSFSIKAESAQNTSILDTIAQLKDALRAPADGDTAATLALNQSLALGLTNLDRGMASVDSARASVGARLNTIDTLTTENESLGIANAAAQSSIRDTDMAEAISRLMLQKTMLEAAQLSFVKVSQLSLFNQM